jgi:hypothetical protein
MSAAAPVADRPSHLPCHKRHEQHGASHCKCEGTTCM